MLINAKLQDITPEILQSMRDEWLPHLEVAPSLPEIHYEKAVDWGEQFLLGQKDKNTLLLALTCTPAGAEPKVLAVMDMTLKHPTIPGQFCLKVMGITVAPQFDFRQGDQADMNIFTRKKAVSVIAAELLIQSIDEMMRRNAVELKIYGNHQVNIDLFELLCADLKEDLLDAIQLTVDSHNNWLVISKRMN